jgi:hypothetical protein
MQVRRTNPTGNPSEGDLMRLALGFFNKTVMPSQAYEVLASTSYDVGRTFAYANCYEVLEERYPARLEPSSLGTTTAGVERGGQQIEFDVHQDMGEGSGSGVAAGAAGDANRETPCHLNGSGPADPPRSRLQGSKAAKPLRRGQYGGDSMKDDIGSVSAALSSYTAAFKSASDRYLTKNEENYQAKKIQAGAASLRAGLDAYKILFSEGAGASAADRDKYCELLRKQEMQQPQSAIQVPTAAPLSLPFSKCHEFLENTSSSTSVRRPSELQAHQSQLVAPPVQFPEGFRCAASCRHPDLPKPSSLCPSPCCKGDETGGRNVHDLCVLEVWEQCGSKWSEPTAGEMKFCSEEWFLTMN